MNLIDRLRGYKTKKVLTIDHDGEVRKSTLRIYPNGLLTVGKIWGSVVAEKDGTVKQSYVERWIDPKAKEAK